MNQAFEEIKYFCVQCTARKYEGWSYCPFCGNSKHYHLNPNGMSVESIGIIRPTKQTVNQCSPEAAGGFQGMAAEQSAQVSSEEDQFNSAIKTVRETFDKLKRSRKLRERAEAELKTAIGKINERDSQIHLLQRDIGRIQRPPPFAIRNVYGQLPGSPTQEVLGILRVEQGYPVCDITVLLPR